MKKKPYPIKAIYGNLVLTEDDKVCAYYKVSSEFISTIDTLARQTLNQKNKHVIDRLLHYGAIDIRLLPRDMTLEERFQHVVNLMPHHTQDIVDTYCQRVLDMVHQEMGRAYVYEWYIGLPLTPLLVKETGAKQVGREWIKSISAFFGYTIKQENWHEAYEELEHQAYSDLSELNVSRLSQEEMYYLTRMNFIRNMPHTIEDERVHEHIAQVCEGVLDFSTLGQVHLGNCNGESYVAFLPLASTDDILTGNDLSELVTRFDFPVELYYQVFHEAVNGVFGGIKRKAEHSKDRLNNIVSENYEKNGEISREKVKTGDIIDDVLNRVEAESDSFVSWTATVAVYGRTEDELSKRIQEVIGYMNKQHLYFVRGLIDQYGLFMKGFLGHLKKQGVLWYHVSTVKGFCEHALFSNNRIGMRTGFYIGRVDTNVGAPESLEKAIYSSHNLVLFNPTIVNKGVKGAKTDSPHIVVTGETGKGKSFLINLIHFYLSFFTKSVYIDVKNEKKYRYLEVINNPTIQQNYPYLVQHLRENFTFVTLDADDVTYHGVLDPILCLEGAEAKGMAETIFYTLYPFKERDIQQVYLSQYLNEVIKEREKGKKVGLMNVVERLMACEDKVVHACGLTIFEKVKHSILMLVFGNEQSQPLSVDTKNTILGLKRLDLPDINTPKSDYTPSQDYSMLVMYALGYFSKVFGSNPEDFTVTYVDEAWVYFSTAIGQAIMREMKRIGRSFNNALILGTQSVKDFSEDDKGNFGTFFAFDEPSEREEILKYLRLPVTEQHKTYLSQFIKGQCLYLDHFGRCQKISIHCPFEEVAELFKTVDKTELSELEQQFV
ncbi:MULTISPECIES: ATP-binding protein [unclassified Granulicatella]|uniref:ATP-binding protein n=1 Tax=unclassified Granulicatella TaxID=2630493 RepID=UPI001073D9E5|nr:MULTISPECIES: ATP-binding protein [unclassified Granulicatella]MBF0780668.1 ATP-binding protein [Granulicatella sp. 19428wC4_WM01]TFU94245.1 hypothetical protein E4T68_06120 [Granulicatella sp. WM01]